VVGTYKVIMGFLFMRSWLWEIFNLLKYLVKELSSKDIFTYFKILIKVYPFFQQLRDKPNNVM